jgi:uncharacterized membrane protein
VEILLLIALGAGAWVLWKRSRGEDPTASSIGKAITGCLGVGCLATVVLVAVAAVLLWLLLGALADVDLSLNEWGGEGESERAPDDEPRQLT